MAKKRFMGTEQELRELMKTVLPKYLYDEAYLLEIENMQEQQKVNVLEAIAKCIDNKLVDNLDYIRTLDGSIHISHFVRDLQTNDNTLKDSYPPCLTKKGKDFLRN